MANYEKLLDFDLNRKIAEYKGWRVEADWYGPRTDTFNAITPMGKPYAWSGTRESVWRDLFSGNFTPSIPRWPEDLNEAILLFKDTGRECCVGLGSVQIDENEYVLRWYAHIASKPNELPMMAWADTPARAVCLVWLYWQEEKAEEE